MHNNGLWGHKQDYGSKVVLNCLLHIWSSLSIAAKVKKLFKKEAKWSASDTVIDQREKQRRNENERKWTH